MPRPKLTERITLRLPEELLADLGTMAARRGCSVNEVAGCCFEYELARMGLYRLDYYDHFRPMLARGQGDSVGHSTLTACEAGKLSDT